MNRWTVPFMAALLAAGAAQVATLGRRGKGQGLDDDENGKNKD
jgi:hypothetical protein